MALDSGVHMRIIPWMGMFGAYRPIPSCFRRVANPETDWLRGGGYAKGIRIKLVESPHEAHATDLYTSILSDRMINTEPAPE
jgi:hypothetical protein